MISRYCVKEIEEIFSDEQKLRLWKYIEVAHSCSLEKNGIIPVGTSRSIVDTEVTLSDHAERERETKHDVAAFVQLLEQNNPGPYSRFVHFGLTSSDIVDTALFLQIRAANSVVMRRVEKLLKRCSSIIDTHKSTIFLSRTHSQAAQPNSFGSFLSSFVHPIFSSMYDIHEVLYYGKLSGATGKSPYWDSVVEKTALDAMGLSASQHPTQIINRSLVYKSIQPIQSLAFAIENLVMQLRLLAQQNVGEIYEYFAEGQIGSSAMPQKRNPISLENVSGICRLLKSQIRSLEDNIVSWYDRDISHSSVERIAIPDIFHMASYVVTKLNDILDVIKIDIVRMSMNYHIYQHECGLEAAMMQEIMNGASRKDAHQRCAQMIDDVNPGPLPLYPRVGIKEYPIFSYDSHIEFEDSDFCCVSDFDPHYLVERILR